MRQRVVVVALGMMTVAGIARAQQPQPQRLPTSVATATMASAVTVQNHRSVPVAVYLEFGQFDRRIGTVDALGTKTLALPRWALAGQSTVRLYVHPEGEPANLGTQQLALKTPTRLQLVVPPKGGMPTMPKDSMTARLAADDLADATITVENPRSVPVTVFAQQQQFDVRLGQVPANGSATLHFPKAAVGAGSALRIFVHPEGGRDLASASMKVGTGEHLGLKVPMQ